MLYNKIGGIPEATLKEIMESSDLGHAIQEHAKSHNKD